MKNLQKLALGLMVAVMAIGFSAFTGKNVKLAGAYYYNQPTQQPWSPINALPADQLNTHYSPISGSPDCRLSTNICTYDLVDGKFVQVTEGTFK